MIRVLVVLLVISATTVWLSADRTPAPVWYVAECQNQAAIVAEGSLGHVVDWEIAHHGPCFTTGIVPPTNRCHPSRQSCSTSWLAATGAGLTPLDPNRRLP